MFWNVKGNKYLCNQGPDVKIERDIYETRNQKRPW